MSANQAPVVHDDLARDFHRYSLLDAMHAQLHGRTFHARLLFGISCTSNDDRTIRSLEEDFREWLGANFEKGDVRRKYLKQFMKTGEEKEEGADGEDNNDPVFSEEKGRLSGALLGGPGYLLHLLEGPLPDITDALCWFNEEAGKPEKGMIKSSLRILFVSELHSVRCFDQDEVPWLALWLPSTGKQDQQQTLPAIPSDEEVANKAWSIYRDLITLLAKAGEMESEEEAFAVISERAAELPTPQVMAQLLAPPKKAEDDLISLFTFQEWMDCFGSPFSELALPSESLFPMPPPLSY